MFIRKKKVITDFINSEMSQFMQKTMASKTNPESKKASNVISNLFNKKKMTEEQAAKVIGGFAKRMHVKIKTKKEL